MHDRAPSHPVKEPSEKAPLQIGIKMFGKF